MGKFACWLPQLLFVYVGFFIFITVCLDSHILWARASLYDPSRSVVPVDKVDETHKISKLSCTYEGLRQKVGLCEFMFHTKFIRGVSNPSHKLFRICELCFIRPAKQVYVKNMWILCSHKKLFMWILGGTH